MITWYIIGIIMFVLQVYVLKHTYSITVDGIKWNDGLEKYLIPIKVPMFVVLLMLLFTIIPYAWTVSTISFWVFWVKKYKNPDSACRLEYYTYWRLRDNFLMKSI